LISEKADFSSATLLISKHKFMECISNYIGIDISKKTLDVAIARQSAYQHYKLPNNQSGFKTLQSLLWPTDIVVMEASGAYYLQVACFLYDQGIGVCVVNPLVIRRFCQMRLSRTKTDRKDATMIAEYGKTEHPRHWVPEADYIMELRQLRAASDLLDKNKTALLCQQEAFDQLPVSCKEATDALVKTIKVIEKQIAIIEVKMQQLTSQYHGTMYKQLQTIPGIGKKTAMLLIVLTGGFTKFSNARQLSSYIGTCPRIFESGSSIKGKTRITKMGMSKIRSMLYVCSWSAKKYNQKCKELYDRFVEKGK
jgi:transposase